MTDYVAVFIQLFMGLCGYKLVSCLYCHWINLHVLEQAGDHSGAYAISYKCKALTKSDIQIATTEVWVFAIEAAVASYQNTQNFPLKQRNYSCAHFPNG